MSGQVPTLNGTIVEGGIQAETALVLEKIGAILEEAGTDWSRVLKTTVLLQGRPSSYCAKNDSFMSPNQQTLKNLMVGSFGLKKLRTSDEPEYS